MAKVFVVDDELTMVQMVTETLRTEGHEVLPFTNAAAALEALAPSSAELVFTDLVLDKSAKQGWDILQKALTLDPPVQVIVMTAYGNKSDIRKAWQAGARDFLEKPFTLDDLKLCVERALSFHKVVTENNYLRKQLDEKYQLNKIIGTSAPMQEIFKLM